jgi:hypothetical protein
VLSIEVFLHLSEDLPFVERAAYKSVNPIELFWWKLGERNAQVIGYRPLGCQRIGIAEFLEGIRVRKLNYWHFRVTEEHSGFGTVF